MIDATTDISEVINQRDCLLEEKEKLLEKIRAMEEVQNIINDNLDEKEEEASAPEKNDNIFGEFSEDEYNIRINWKSGSSLEIWSDGMACWAPGVVKKIVVQKGIEFLLVEYYGNREKIVERLNRDILRSFYRKKGKEKH